MAVPQVFFFFFVTLITGPRRSLSLNVPQVQAHEYTEVMDPLCEEKGQLYGLQVQLRQRSTILLCVHGNYYTDASLLLVRSNCVAIFVVMELNRFTFLRSSCS